MSANNLFL